MDAWPCVRLASNLNSLVHRQQSVEQAERAVRGSDVAHHVVDPDGVLGLDPLLASPLDDALPVIAAREPEAWFLALPVPGVLAPLRGPADLNRAALEIGEAVVAAGGGVALVPYPVGRAVQWRVFAAERPFSPASPYEAGRDLSEAVIAAAAVLTQLDVAAGSRPGAGRPLELAPGYGARQQATADRAARLIEACDVALADDGGSLSVYEADRRAAELRRVRHQAATALASAVSWLR